MGRRDNGWAATIAISISESPDLTRLGMSDRHLTGAMETMATYLLSFGYRLAYGGDLRQGGFTEQLFELVRPLRPLVPVAGPAGRHRLPPLARLRSPLA